MTGRDFYDLLGGLAIGAVLAFAGEWAIRRYREHATASDLIEHVYEEGAV